MSVLDRARTGDGASSAPALNIGDPAVYRAEWLCERWSQDAVDFAQRKLVDKGVRFVEGHQVQRPIGSLDKAQRIRLIDQLRQLDLDEAAIFALLNCAPAGQLVSVPALVPVALGQIPSSVLRDLIGAPDGGEQTVHGNLLLNEGIAVMLDLTFGLASPTAFANASAQLGVGDSTTAESASQTDLQASTNKLFVGMNSTFPSRSSQTVTAQSDFTSGQANYAWQEVSLRNSSGSDKNFNRKVTSLGTKATGTWTLSLAATIS